MEQFEARSYQLEMLDQSLRQNIIVVVRQTNHSGTVYAN